MISKEKLAIILALLGLYSHMHAMQTQEILVKLPSASVIKKRLEKRGLNDFVRKTDIDTKLGDQEVYPDGVVLDVELTINDYVKSLGLPASAQGLAHQGWRAKMRDIIEPLLQDYPEAIKQLEDAKLITTSKKNYPTDEQKVVLVKMPSASVLRHRIAQRGLRPFADKTNIHIELADKELYPHEVLLEIRKAIYKYVTSLNLEGTGLTPSSTYEMWEEERTRDLVEPILQDSPEVIKALEDEGSIKRSRYYPYIK